MADSFDPYLRWLGIRDPQRPPNHYRLLGVDLFEDDSDIIAVAADRQMAHVRTFQAGQLVALSQRLLNELAAARICLLKPDKKAAYDDQLKKQLGAVPVAVRPKPQSAAAAGLPVAARVVAVTGDEMPGVGSRVAVAEEFPDFASLASATGPNGLAASSVTNKSNLKTSAFVARKKKSLGPWIGLAAAGILLVIGVVVVQSMNEPIPPVAMADGAKRPAAEVASNRVTAPVKAGDRGQGSGVRGQGAGGNLASTPASDAATLAPLNGSRPEPPVRSPRDVALVDNPPQHEPSDNSPSPDKSADPDKVDPPAPIKTAPIKTAPAKTAHIQPPQESPARPELSGVPDKEALTGAEKTIQSIYKSEVDQANRGGPEAKAALAKQWIARGMETTDNSAARYVLLTKARDFAIAGGDVQASVDAVNKLAGLYSMPGAEDPMLTSFASLTKTVRTRDTAESLRLAAEKTADESIAADNYDLAGKYLRLAVGISTKLRDQVSVAELKAKLAEVEQCKKEFGKLSDSFEKLKSDPDDPEANLAVGRFFALTKGDFDRALPCLAKASGAELKSLATTDLTSPTDPAEQAKLGDGWWALAESAHEPAKSHLQTQAAIWYSKAAPKLKGLAKGEVDARLKEVGNVANSGGTLTRAHVARILTDGEWQIHFEGNPSSAKEPDHSGYSYLHYRFMENGAAKNEATPLGHWSLEGDTVSVSYDGLANLLHRFRIVGNSLQAEAYRPPDPAIKNHGIGSKVK